MIMMKWICVYVWMYKLVMVIMIARKWGISKEKSTELSCAVFVCWIPFHHHPILFGNRFERV